MKKSLIALAVSGAMLAPVAAQADATLYGSLRLKVSDFDNAETDVGSGANRIGMKGSSDLYSGAKAIFHFEQGVDSDEGAFDITDGGRLAYVGATGDFGTATIGKQWSSFWSFTNVTDILSNVSSGGTIGKDRVSDMVGYQSPDISGLKFAAAAFADDTSGSTNNGSGSDGYNLSASYSIGGFYAGASLFSNDHKAAGGKADITAFALSYSTDALTLAARVEDNEEQAAGEENRYALAATYGVGHTTFGANFSDFDNAGSSFSIEATQKLGKQASGYIAYVDEDDVKGDNDGFEVGYRVDF